MKKWFLFLLGFVSATVAVIAAVGGEVSFCLGNAGQGVMWLGAALVLAAIGWICLSRACRSVRATSPRGGIIAGIGAAAWVLLVIGFFAAIRMNDAGKGLRDINSDVDFELTRSFDNPSQLQSGDEVVRTLERKLALAGWWASGAKKAEAREKLSRLKSRIAEARQNPSY